MAGAALLVSRALVVAVLTAAAAPSACQGTNKLVQVSVSAPWGPAPLVMEAAEFFEGDAAQSFWPFVDALGANAAAGTDEAQFKAAEEAAQKVVSDAQAKLMRFALALRDGSPRLEMHRSSWASAESKGCSISSPDGAVAVVGAKCIAEAKGLREAVQKCSERDDEHLSVHDGDRVYSSQASPAPPAVFLYATVGTKAFQDFHRELVKLSDEGLARYVLRHTWSGWRKGGDCTAGEELPLQGYGVELAVKNMEYKAVDDAKVDASGNAIADGDLEGSQEVGGFDFKKLLERMPGLEEELGSFRDALTAEISKSDEVKVWALKDLGIQASQHIMQAREPLKLMRDLSHNLPSLVSTISRLKVNASMQQEIEGNHQFMPAGHNLVLLNGRTVDPEDTTPFGLLSTLKFEVGAIESLLAVGLDVKSARKLLLGGGGGSRGMMMGGGGEGEEFLLDINDGSYVYWLNNLEKDERYHDWGRGLDGLLTRGWPGQLKYVAKNLYSAIFVVDASKKSGLRVIAMAKQCIEQRLPIRFGLIFESETALAKHRADQEAGTPEEDMTYGDAGEQLFRLFRGLHKTHGHVAAMVFAGAYAEKAVFMDDPERMEQMRKEEFRSVAKMFKPVAKDESGKLTRLKYKAALNATEGRTKLAKSTEFVRGAGLNAAEEPALVINGQMVQGSGEEELIRTVQFQQQMLQRKVYYGEVDDRSPIYKQVVGGSAHKRYHPLIVEGPQSSKLFVSSEAIPHVGGLQWAACPGADDRKMRGVSHLVAADLSTDVGQTLVLEALAFLAGAKGDVCARARIAFVDNAREGGGGGVGSEALAAIQRAAGVLGGGGELTRVAEEAISHVKRGAWPPPKGSLSGDYVGQGGGLASEAQRAVAAAMGLKGGVSGVATAGRVFEVSAKVPFKSGDFGLAQGVEWAARAKHVAEVVAKTKFQGSKPSPGDLSDVALKGCVVVASQAKHGVQRQELPSMWKGQLTGFSVGDPGAMIGVTAFLDPLSPATQRVAPLLMALAEGFGARIQVMLNPKAVINEVPIKGYFRYVLSPVPRFDDGGALVASHRATFNNLPTSKLLTMVIHSPDAWFVEASRCAYDMDNILLDKVTEPVLSAHYELNHLLLTGHASDEYRSPPAGLQLALTGGGGEPISDTLVMSNLGYFQLKARPGVWTLDTPPAGRSRDLYEVGRAQGGKGIQVSVSSFQPGDIHLSADKRPGMEHESLIGEEGGEEEGGGSLWGSISSSLFGTGADAKAAAAPAAGRNETMHVFSLASGHLYERFLRIMMLSVVRNTQRPVKFWLLRNFLSPKFKREIPALARKHGFEVELVTYKWPSWLHRQTEKQRIIWGYKILMLDVLFPLSVDKIVYIDSDQVVRADLAELWDMDLKGRPLAYVPFCDSNKDMEGYRFWKQGFWQQHLGSNKYHISALYVVDLRRFRATGAGDQLRVIYSQLSRDPNSLANLDQDLPNYAQHSVPIFSLPQEWLWCETWCSGETKAAAKTIDLCNNPMTKEPKLDQARRIVGEWGELDDLQASSSSEEAVDAA